MTWLKAVTNLGISKADDGVCFNVVTMSMAWQEKRGNDGMAILNKCSSR